MRRLFALGVVTTLTVGAACSSFSGATDPPPIADGGDAEPAEAGADGPVVIDDSGPADAAVDTQPRLANGDFEQGCVDWSAVQATTTAVNGASVVHGGGSACRVCGGDAGPTYQFYQDVTTSCPVGAHFEGTAWVRTAPSGANATGISVRLQLLAADGITVVATGAFSNFPIGGVYSQVTAALDVTTDAGAKVALTFRGQPTDTCFLIDDAVLTRTP